MIPKVIHYCWFGRGEKSRLMKKCIKSWKKYCPDYEIIEWNEDNFDINENAFVKQAYECKKWAFVADYARLKVLYEYGGIYLDTDQELIKGIDKFIEFKAFMGFLDDENVSCGIIGCEKELPIIKEFLEIYNDSFIKDGKQNLIPNTDYITNILAFKGLKMDDNYQVVSDMHIFPKTVFCPTTCIDNKKFFSKDTVAIHHWAMTWRKPSEIKTFKRVKRHKTWWYRLYENIKILPQKTLRQILSNDTVDKIKAKLGK